MNEQAKPRLYKKKRKEQRQEEAQERQATYDKLSPEQKTAKLDQKFGKGLGAKKQRAKLQKSIEKNV